MEERKNRCIDCGVDIPSGGKCQPCEDKNGRTVIGWGESIREHLDQVMPVYKPTQAEEFDKATAYMASSSTIIDQQLEDLKQKLATYQELAAPLNLEIGKLQMAIWEIESPIGYKKWRDKEDHV